MGKLTPTDMQIADADELLKYEHGLNWSLPGTGKTMTSVCVIDRGRFKRVLVICPKIAVSMWLETLVTQLGMRAIARRAGTAKAWKSPLDDVDVVVTTYAVAAGEHAQAQLKPWLEGVSIVIFDEAHYCKNKDAKRSRALLAPPGREVKIKGPDGKEYVGRRGAVGDIPGLATHANYVLQLTGTPMTRYPDDLWMQLAYVRAEVLEAYGVGSYQNFVRKFCVEGDMQVGNGRRVRVVKGAKNEAQMRELVENCRVVRRTLADVMDELPEVTERWLKADVVLPKKVDVNENDTPAEVLRKLKDKDSAYAKVWHKVGLAKVPEVVEYIKETYPDTPVLIGFWHTDVGRALSKALDAPMVYGGTPSRVRDELRGLFNGGKLSYLIGQVSAMGVSWNLQEAAHTVVFAELIPSRGDVDQFVARVMRKGQKNHVQADFIGSNNSIDEALKKVCDYKQAIEARIIQ